VNPFVLVGAAAAALVTGVLIMMKGGIIEKRSQSGPGSMGGSADGSGIPTLGDDQEDPFKTHAGARRGPAPTQTETSELSSGPGDPWMSDGGDPSVTYQSPGDGGVTYFNPQTQQYDLSSPPPPSAQDPGRSEAPAGSTPTARDIFYAPAPYVPGTSSAGGGGGMSRE
jgi:hypothetical protein